jgi:hypothetical protein
MFGFGAGRVRHVVVNGEVVVRDRQLTRVDANELAVEARGASRHLRQQLEGIGPHPFEPTRLLAGSGSG